MRKSCSCIRRECGPNKLLNKLLPGPFWRVGLGNPYDIEQTTFALNLIPRLGRKFDIVHTQDPLCALILQRARHLGLIKAPCILGHGTEEPFDFLKKIDFLQHLAPYHMEEAREAGCYREGWSAIGNFVDTEVFHPGNSPELRAELGIPPTALVFLSVAAVKKHHKRIDYLLEEVTRFAEQTQEDMHLVVAGASTEQTEELTALANDLLGDRAHFLLNQPRSRMPDILRMGDVFVLCSLKEMMPIALLEATASGLPCLVSTHPVVNWMIGEGGQGVAMEREGVLAEALHAYTDAAFRSRKSEAAREHAVTHFSKEAIVNQYLQLYESVIALSAGENRT